MVSSEGKKGTNVTPHLSFDLLFKIFLCLPIEFLCNSARYVCKEWLRVIRDPSFIEAHLMKSKAVLLIHESSEPYGSISLYEENGKFSENPLGLSFPGMPMDSCRGLCLFFGTAKQHASLGTKRKRAYNSRLHVVNPATKQIQELPSLGNGSYMCFHLSYISESGKYKVVCCFSNSGNFNWFVFTLGTDVSWGKLHAVLEVVHPTSVTVRQFLFFSQSRGAIVAVNLHDETISSIQMLNGFTNSSFWLLKRGDRLCCAAHQGRVVHTWVLRDLKGCEWIKDCDYQLSARTELHLHFCLVGWLDNGQIFISEHRWMTSVYRSEFSAHFAKTGKVVTIAFSRNVPFYCLLIHANSLVRW